MTQTILAWWPDRIEMKNNPRGDQSLPVRLTLVDQAVEFIRQALRDNRWGGTFPSEAELGRELGVSRGTLRRALSVLFDDGLLTPGGRGGRHLITGMAVRRRPNNARAGDLVRILSPQPRFILGDQTQLVLQTASESLGRAGLHLEFDYHPGLWKLRRPDSALRKITSQPDTAGWLLYRSTQAVQKWFADSGIPAVALGQVYPEVALSYAAFDLVAASRHAAGVFASRGRRRVIFLTVENATAGDYACGRAFLEAAAAAGLHARTVVYDDTVEGLCHVLDSLLVERPAPSGYLVAVPNHAPATIGHLNRRGFPVPRKAAVISRMDARLLVESIPSVARYEMDAERLGRGIARLLRQSINTERKGGPETHIVMPEFVDGESAGCKSNS